MTSGSTEHIALATLKEAVEKLAESQAKLDRRLRRGEKQRKRVFAAVALVAVAVLVLTGLYILLAMGRDSSRAYYNNGFHAIVCTIGEQQPPGQNPDFDHLRDEYSCPRYGSHTHLFPTPPEDRAPSDHPSTHATQRTFREGARPSPSATRTQGAAAPSRVRAHPTRAARPSPTHAPSASPTPSRTPSPSPSSTSLLTTVCVLLNHCKELP